LGSPLEPHTESDLATNVYCVTISIAIIDESGH
jgi:hypothetical protein